MIFKETQCSCKDCQAMCHWIPCLPTPKEAKKLQQAGFASSLTEVFRERGPDSIRIIAPKTKSGGNGWGTCVFLKNGLCELHSLGLKPLEGRTASCKGNFAQDAVFNYILDLWERENAGQ